MSIRDISASTLSVKLLAKAKELKAANIPFNCSLINNLQAIWVPSQKRGYFGVDLFVAEGETLEAVLQEENIKY